MRTSPSLIATSSFHAPRTSFTAPLPRVCLVGLPLEQGGGRVNGAAPSVMPGWSGIQGRRADRSWPYTPGRARGGRRRNWWRCLDDPPSDRILPAVGTRVARVPELCHTLQKRVTAMNFRPLHDRVLVRRVEAEEKTGRRDHHSRHRQGKAAGRRSRRRRHRPARDESGKITRWTSRPATSILFGKWSGTEVKVDTARICSS